MLKFTYFEVRTCIKYRNYEWIFDEFSSAKSSKLSKLSFRSSLKDILSFAAKQNNVSFQDLLHFVSTLPCINQRQEGLFFLIKLATGQDELIKIALKIDQTIKYLTKSMGPKTLLGNFEQLKSSLPQDTQSIVWGTTCTI